MASRAALPPGFTELHFPEVDSTNAEALRRAGQSAGGKLWVRADSQTAGRGRSGRQWESARGNLFASVLLRPACKLETAVQLAFVAGLAAFDTVAALDATFAERLRLKWPNDLLLDMQKVAGILLESVPSGSDEAPAVVVGTGLNLASHPEGTAFPATDLAAHGGIVPPERAFEELARATAHWLEAWSEGEGWPHLRAEWEARSLPKGAAIRVHAGRGSLSGTIAGIDERGALLIDTGGASPVAVTAGDVFLI